MIEWKKAAACADAACVEVKIKTQQVRVRNSEFTQAELGFTYEQWREFVQMVKAGEFDL